MKIKTEVKKARVRALPQATEDVDVGCGGMGLRVGFININDMYKMTVGKGGSIFL